METPRVFQNSEVSSGQSRQSLQCHLDSWVSPENEVVGFAFRENPVAAVRRESLQGPGSLHREVEMAGQTAGDWSGPKVLNPALWDVARVWCVWWVLPKLSLVDGPGWSPRFGVTLQKLGGGGS